MKCRSGSVSLEPVAAWIFFEDSEYVFHFFFCVLWSLCNILSIINAIEEGGLVFVDTVVPVQDEVGAFPIRVADMLIVDTLELSTSLFLVLSRTLRTLVIVILCSYYTPNYWIDLLH